METTNTNTTTAENFIKTKLGERMNSEKITKVCVDLFNVIIELEQKIEGLQKRIDTWADEIMSINEDIALMRKNDYQGAGESITQKLTEIECRLIGLEEGESSKVDRLRNKVDDIETRLEDIEDSDTEETLRELRGDLDDHGDRLDELEKDSHGDHDEIAQEVIDEICNRIASR